MDIAIETGEELIENFFQMGRAGGIRAETAREKGVFINGKVRKDVLTSIGQGRITIEGRVRNIEFENIGGGVYRAFMKAQQHTNTIDKTEGGEWNEHRGKTEDQHDESHNRA